MENGRVKWGIIGTAWIAKERLIPAINAAENSELLAIASRSEEKAKDFAKTYSIPRTYTSYEGLLQDPNVDAVYIPLPNHLHKEWTIRAAEAGKHILCEKPAALSVKEIEEMVFSCCQNKVVFMEAFAFRFHPEWRRLRQIVDSGQIGDLRTVQIRFSISVENSDDIRLNPSLGGGVLYDIGSYCINGIRYIMGNEPLEVQAFADFDDNNVDVSVVSSMRFPGGRLAQFACTFQSDYNQSLEISGTEGIIRVNFPFRHPQIMIQKNGKEEKKVFQDPVNAYVSQVEHISNCILMGKSPSYSPEESIANLKVIQSVYNYLKQQ
ncbi:Gfo/Idh/MocA family protein [Bacillus timonensis]|uniref:Gfo/Idh/MocA family protein n=1 Tax=Bacillus timonensis TaxID=1033734 RepID=UPI001386D284|nr:Gfo/Idh/MocA family oxidoreductase [Bacillus timonensis]